MSFLCSMRPFLSKRVVGVAKSHFVNDLKCLSFRQISSSRFLLANVTVNVPALGESISEGSVASFEKAIGDAVEVDDVIAVIETDKVTVEIKSPYRGTMATLHCAPGDEVTVGSQLYTIDTNDDVVASPPAASDSKEGAQTASSSSSASAPSSESSHQRVPLIKFLGKRSLLKHAPSSAHASATTPSPASAHHSPAPVDRHSLSPVAAMFDGYDAATLGRPGLTAAEMEAVETGGASLFA